MKEFIEEYGGLVVVFLVGLLCMSGLFAVIKECCLGY